MSSQNQTPLMKQYWDIKSLHQDKILLFRMGDFFEMFFDDAVKAAPVIGIALTSRNKKGGDETPMCGFPHHSVAGPINKLLAAGFKVAMCEQIEDPKMAKGLVKRAVTRVLTPGMVYDLETLDGTRAHYLASFDENSLSLLDTSTGEAFWLPVSSTRDVVRYLDSLSVAEVVLPEKPEDGVRIAAPVTIHEKKMGTAHALLPAGSPASAARLLSYVQSLSGDENLKTINPFAERRLQNRLSVPPVVLRHLEIFETYKGAGQGSLFHAIDRTRTSAGSRLLRQWVSFPLTDDTAIEARLNVVEAWRQRPSELKKVREILGHMGDIERRLGKIPQPTCNARDLLALAASVEAGISALTFAGQAENTDRLLELSQKITAVIVQEPPLSTKQGYLIQKGVRPELDELIVLSTDAQSLLSAMEADEREKTGISSLKIRYNNVFGFYIEITNTHKDRAPARYQRKQTLANAERYCTDELIELERKVLSAQTRRNEMESEIFETLRREVLSTGSELLGLAQRCSELDVFSSLAWLALERNFCRPRFHKGGHLTLKSSRHVVVEQSVGRDFVANDIELGTQACLLLTGPNMAGKSTLMRQVALTALMAQMGSFVPALSAEMPIFDAIYTRIGASDQLSEGLSTFMVEMTETAAMLKEATSKSLVILDEVGRGTSTFDGMCLAQSILEYLLKDVRCLTLFATHYHEITALHRLWPQILNAHMSVSDRGGEIRFLHTLVQGPAMKSYGVQVADLAGLPATVTKRAKQLLKEIENKAAMVPQGSQMSLLDVPMAFGGDAEIEFEDGGHAHEDGAINGVAVKISAGATPVDTKKEAAMQKLVAEIREVPLSQLTPLEALNRVARWQESCLELS